MNRLFVVFAVCVWALFGTREAAVAQTADPAFDRDVVKMMEVTGSGKVGEQLATLAARQMIDQLRRLQPNAPPRAIEIINEVVQAQFATALGAPDGFTARMIPIYEKYFTHDEVLALLAFYDTDLGRKTVAVMPTLAQEGAKLGLEWANGLASAIKSELETRFKAEGLVK